ncbi:MAG: hypothetical protein ABH934_04135 [Chloroflexota bacterium]
MVMWRMKGCPKCGGDVFLDIEESMLLDHCLQCGYMHPRAKEFCPHCDLEMVIEKHNDNKSYHCIKCGYSKELHQVGNK